MSGRTPSPAPWPLDVFPAGNVAVGAQLWRYRNQLHVTLVGKATFALVPGGEARPAPAEAVVREAVHATNNPASALVAERELWPWLSRAEIVFTGHAHAPAGVPTPRMPVRLALRRGDRTLVDKRLEIVGDRFVAAGPQASEPEPKPFVRMPIAYQRAWGGPGLSANPLGVGMVSSGGRIELPNILAPDGSRTPVGLGPIPAFWPARKNLLRGAARPELSPIPALPDDFDGAYFQTAPEDQRFDSVRGGEHILLEGLHPQYPVLETRLPALRGLATLFLPSGAQRWLSLSGDSLIVKGDAGLCSVVFRSHLQVASDDALPGLRVAVGVEIGGQPVAWPDPAEVLARPPIDVHGDEPSRAFEVVDWSATLTLGDSEIEEPASVGAVAPRQERTSTLPAATLVGPKAGAGMHAPFPLAPAGTRGSRDSGDIPGAPWATQQASVKPLPNPLDATLAPIEPPASPPVEAAPIESPAVPRPRLPPEPAAAPPPAAPPPAAPPLPPREADRNVWAEPAPAPPPPAPPPKPSPAKPNLVSNMYKRFRKG